MLHYISVVYILTTKAADYRCFLNMSNVWQQKLEKKKALYIEKMQNKLAEIHKTAEEKRAMVVEGKRIERNKVDKKADDFREVGLVPKKILPCFNYWINF